MDQIRIDNLQIFAHHGVYQEENEKGQNFYVNAVLETDTMPRVFWMIWRFPRIMGKCAGFWMVLSGNIRIS